MKHYFLNNINDFVLFRIANEAHKYTIVHIRLANKSFNLTPKLQSMSSKLIYTLI